MVARRTQSGLPPTTPPGTDVVSPGEGTSLSGDLMYRMMLDVQRAQGATEQALTYLTSAIDKQGQQMGKIDDIRVDIARMSTVLEQLGTDMGSTKGKVDKARLWIAGATAIIALLVVIVPIVLRYLPPPSTGTGGASQTERSRGR